MRDFSQDIRSGVAVVTGAGAGLGHALSLALADQGIRVAAIGRKAPSLADLRDAAGDHLFPFVADVSDAAITSRVFEDIATTAGPPAILINNAAVYPHRDILDETPDSFMQTVEVNLGGAFNCCHAVLPGMIAQGYGRIVNVVSFADLAPAPAAAAYSVSKGAQRILTRALIADLGDRFPDIIINDWIPGALRTQMGIPDGIAPAKAAKWGARLALMHDRNMNGMVFDRDREHREPESFKRRLFNRLTGRAVPPLELS